MWCLGKGFRGGPGSLRLMVELDIRGVFQT